MCTFFESVVLAIVLVFVCGNCESKPSFSVVIPVYNVKEFISRALDSVVNQNYDNVEILCMDDKSLDNSAEIIAEYTLRDKRIKLVLGEVNIGLDAVRNRGMRLAQNDWILFLDSDDWYEAGLFHKLSEVIQNNAAINIIEFPFDYAFADEKGFKYKPGPLSLGESGIRKSENVNLMEVPAPWNKVFRRAFLVKHNLENNEVHAQAESVFTVSCFVLSHEFYYLDFIGYHYFKNTKSMTQSLNTRFSADAVERMYLNPIEKGLGKYGIHSDELCLGVTLRLITWWVANLIYPRDKEVYGTARRILLSLPHVDKQRSVEIQSKTKIPHDYELYCRIYDLPYESYMKHGFSAGQVMTVVVMVLAIVVGVIMLQSSVAHRKKT